MLVDFWDCVIYYVGFVDLVGIEVVGFVGLIILIWMDGYSDMMLEWFGVVVMIGKVECGV